jgi:hypothetical protein
MPTKTITPWEFGAYVTEPVRTTISALLWALHGEGGTIRSESGRVGTALRDRAVELGYFIHPRYQASSKSASGGISSLLASLELDTYGTEAIEREKNGTRSFEIRLLLDDEEMPPKPVLVKKTLGDSTEPVANPVDVSQPIDAVEHVEQGDLTEGWDDIDAPNMAPDTVDLPDIATFEIETLPEVITVSDTPSPYGLVLEAQRSITRALVSLAGNTPPPVDHTELLALRARVNVLTEELANVRAERDRLMEILAASTIRYPAENGAAS